MKEKLRKIITLSDLHFPTHINLDPIIKFIKYEKPDEVIYLGDIVNADGISRFWEGDIEEGVYHTVQEIKGFVKEIHNKIRKVAPKAKITLTGGNHLEARVRKAIVKKGFREEYLNLHNYLPDVNILEYGKIYSIGKLNYTHGFYYNQHHAVKHLSLGINLIYGHTHQIMEASGTTILGDKPLMAKSIGCLCKLNPDYRRNQPNNWANAFHIAYVKPDGNFYEYTIRIIDNSFYFNNKLYK